MVLSSENRSYVASDGVVERRAGRAAGPTPDPVAVTVASREGWSLVGVLAGSDLDAKEAIALIAARGLDAALRPLAGAAGGGNRLSWIGAERSDERGGS